MIHKFVDVPIGFHGSPVCFAASGAKGTESFHAGSEPPRHRGGKGTYSV